MCYNYNNNKTGESRLKTRVFKFKALLTDKQKQLFSETEKEQHSNLKKQKERLKNYENSISYN